MGPLPAAPARSGARATAHRRAPAVRASSCVAHISCASASRRDHRSGPLRPDPSGREMACTAHMLGRRARRYRLHSAPSAVCELSAQTCPPRQIAGRVARVQFARRRRPARRHARSRHSSKRLPTARASPDWAGLNACAGHRSALLRRTHARRPGPAAPYRCSI